MINVEKIVAVIRAEQELIAGSLVDTGLCISPGHCAIGALLFAAGMTNVELQSMPDAPDEWDTDRPFELLNEHYGIRGRHADLITHANDESLPGLSRQDAVIKTVERLAAEQALRPMLDDMYCAEWDDDAFGTGDLDRDEYDDDDSSDDE